jgi:hypothetical protein
MKGKAGNKDAGIQNDLKMYQGSQRVEFESQ